VDRALRNHWRWLLVAFALAVLAARVAWIASHTATGWETIASDWREATVGQFAGHRLPVSQRDMAAQTEFWLAEIDRVLGREPHTPELLLGAVRMLGSFSCDYHLPPSAELLEVPDLDHYHGPNSRGWPDKREPDRRAKQLQLAAEATAEFPDFLSAWQTRAEKCSQRFGPAEEPRNATDWRKILQDCERHDPENSFYNFLIAYHLLSDAGNIAGSDEAATANGNPPTDAALIEHKQQEIELENAALEEVKNGLQLPKFEWPDARAAIKDFIEKTGLPLVERAHLISWSGPDNLLGGIPDQLVNVAARIESREPGTDTKDVRRMAIQICELNDRHPPRDPIDRLRETFFWADQWKKWAVYLSRDLDAPVPQEAIVARSKAIDLQTTANQFNRALMNWSSGRALPPFDNTWIGYIAWKAAALAMQCFLIALLAIAVWKALRLTASTDPRLETVRLGSLRHFVTWFVAIFASIIVLGLAPAEVISHSVQGWIAIFAFILAMLALPVLVAIPLRGQISMRTLLSLVVVYALIFTALFWWDAIAGDKPLHRFPPAVWVPARGASGISAEQLQSNVTQAVRGKPVYSFEWKDWAAVQWVLYHGAEWTISGALFGIAFWCWLRANCERKQAALAVDASQSKRANLLSGLFHVLARTALGAAVVALAIYLVLAPERIEHFEAIYRFESQQVQNPDAFWAGLQKKFDELMADEKAVAVIRQQAEREFDTPDDSQ
jgi:hypothetical protein